MTLEQDFLDGLKAIIDMRGEKNAPLSKRSGMGDTGIRDLFRNGSMPKVTNAKAIADQLNVTIDDIFRASNGVEALKEPSRTTNFPAIPRYSAIHSLFQRIFTL